VPERARRIPALDSLRGIAAAAVVLQHAMWCAGWRSIAPNAHWAVMLFFTLSGFVLALPYVEGRAATWSKFLVRRFFRLWPPVVVAVVVSATLCWLIGVRPPYVAEWWREPLNADLLTRCLLLTGQHGGCASLDLPLWSLVYEARLSLVFPALALLTLRWPRQAIVLAVVGGFSLEVLERLCGGITEPLSGSALLLDAVATLQCGALFVIGVALAMRASGLSFNRGSAALLGICSIALLAMASDVGNGVGAAIAIALAVGTAGLSRILLHPVLRWLGRISYSLYLIHVPLLAACVYGFGGPLAPATVVVAVGLCLLAAEIMFRMVELPSIAMGRRLTEHPRPLSLRVGSLRRT
jgi:peptidoglycan/LPS O-acetylase OafA/YrhL